MLFCDAMKPLVNSHLILWSATTNTLQSAICMLTILSQFQICSRMQSASINSPVESSNWPKSGNMMQRPQSTPTDLSRRSWDGEEYVLPPIDLLRLDRSPLEILMEKAYSGNRQGSAQQEPGGSPRLKSVRLKGDF